MITAEELQKRIDKFPRVRLVHLPTPLERMPRLTASLNGPQLWIKREDCTGLAFGGNKERKAEFALGDALSKKADVVITTGPTQSNHARATAAAASKLGVKAILVITGEEPGSYDGNLLLNRLLGAEIRLLGGKPSKSDRARFMEEIAADLRKMGHIPYVIPAGASYPPGAAAYVNAMLELLRQARDYGFKIDNIVHAAGSGGTQAGLVLADKALGSEVAILGICAEPGIKNKLIEETVGIAVKTASLLDLKTNVMSDDVVLNEDYVGEACEKPTSEALRAIKLVAQTEGILLDPIYTGRAMAGLINLIKQGHYKRDDNVVFLHTGGTPALFPYRKEFV
ncbi:MAG TPA: D-cysteine desulfhydrase family protein [Candidatus Bathyarchaeia archaeon]|nr:D-cysteine desulfhydrase family protein [Candidatus Bathyarchaeia archaeon]